MADDFAGERTLAVEPAAVRVVDESERVLPGVGVWREAPGKGVYVPEDDDWLGETDAEGRLRIQFPAGALIIGSPDRLCVRQPVHESGEAVVTLALGRQVTFRCRTFLEDEPVAGVVCAVTVEGKFTEGSNYDRRVPSNQAARELVPPPGAVVAPPLKSRVFRAVADASGLVRFQGLPDAPSYIYFGWPPREDMALVAGPGLNPGDDRLVTPNGPVHTLGFAELRFCGYRVEGAKVIGGNNPVHIPPMPREFLPSFALMQGVHVRDRLEAELPPDTHLSIVPAAEYKSLNLVLDNGGRIRDRLPFVSFEEFTAQGPVVLQAPDSDGNGVRTSLVEVRIVQPDGSSIDGVDLRLIQGVQGAWIGVTSGEPVRLPWGSYRAMVKNQPAIQSAAARALEIEVGPGDATEQAVPIEVRLDTRLFPVQVTHPATLERVVLRGENSGGERSLALDGERSEIWLREGDYEFVTVAERLSIGRLSVRPADETPRELALELP